MTAELTDIHGPLTATGAVGSQVERGVRPLAWIRLCSDGTYEGPIADCDSRMDGVRRTCGAWTPLYPQEELSPEFTDTARAALLWVLWHHQGGSSPVGQPIRFALGMGAHEPPSERQVAEAKRWAAMTRSTTAEFHRRGQAA